MPDQEPSPDWGVNDKPHFPECDDQPTGAECICDEIEQGKRDEEANNGETEFEGR